jgi:serine phosphatase RsbU (regulator of sigma subunit)
MEVWGGNCEVDRGFEMPGLQTWIFSRPHGNAQDGGDVYYISSCASGRITRMLLADVSGHGQGVADLARGLRELMRKHVNVVSQVKFVEKMNRQFAKLPDCEAFATALVSTFFQPTRRLTICNAGHPSPLLYRARTGTWSAIDHGHDLGVQIANMPLGVHDQTTYPQLSLTLESEDMVLFFSDALTECLDERGNMLGVDGLLRLVASSAGDAGNHVLSRILGALRAKHPENLTADDLTVLLCRTTDTRTTLRDNLLAPVRLFRQARDRTRLN